MSTPALPAGYALDVSPNTGATPPLPSGYTLDAAAPKPQKQYAPGRSFGMDVARGMGLDADKIAAAEDSGGEGEAWKEMGRQVFEGLSDLATRVAKDPFTLKAIPVGMARSLEDGIKAKSPGQIVGAMSSILGGAESAEDVPEAAGAVRGGIAKATRDEAGNLRPGVKVAARAAGAAAGHATGIPGAEIAGVFSGPSLADAILPSREVTIAKAVPIRQSPNFDLAAYRAGQQGIPSGNPSPFPVRVAASATP